MSYLVIFNVKKYSTDFILQCCEIQRYCIQKLSLVVFCIVTFFFFINTGLFFLHNLTIIVVTFYDVSFKNYRT